MTITFGAETLAGFGGYHLSGMNMTNLRDSGGALSSDFQVNPVDSDIVPGIGYGGPPPAYNGPYTATLSDGLSSSVLTITIAPKTSTVKSHYGFPAGDNPDSPTSFQLATVLGSTANIHLGDTVVMRGGTGEVGPTPALNPLDMSTHIVGGSTIQDRYFINVPETSGGASYSGSGRISIQCEVANTATDANGNPVQGGNCDVGGLVINSAYDIQVPFDFVNVHFYVNHPTVGPNASPNPYLLSYKGLGEGVGVYRSRFEWGPTITSAYDRINVLTSLNMRLGTAANNVFVGGQNGILGASPDVTTPWYITSNIFSGLVSDGIDYGLNTSGADAKYNFFFNFAGGTPNPSPGDGFTIGAKTYSFVAPGAAMTDGQVPISPNADQTAANMVCTVMAGGSGCVAGVNYPAAEAADNNVSAAVRSVNGPTYVVTITSAVSALVLSSLNSTYGATAASSFAWDTPSIPSPGGTASLTFSPNHADTFQLDGATLGYGVLVRAGPTDYNLSARGVESPNVGVRQFYFMNPVNQCCFVGGEVKNNISYLTAGNSILVQRFNDPNISDNTTLADAGSTGYAPNDPSYDTLVNSGGGPGWYALIAPSTNKPLTDGGGGATFVNNLGNFVSIGAQTALGSIPSYSFVADTSGSTMTVRSGYTVPVASTPLTGPGLPTVESAKSVVGNVITLGSAVTTPQTGATFTTIDPFFGQPSGMLNISGNESANWSGSSPNKPLSGAPVTAFYRSFLPNYPATGGVLVTNRAQDILIHTPSVGTTFVGAIASKSAPYQITVTSGAVPTAPFVINGPDIPSGDVVVGVSGATLTLLFAPTGTGSGLNYGVGAMNPDGTYNGALFPNGCWNDNSVYDPATACTAAQ